jgi:two-component sensor histidine kinase
MGLDWELSKARARLDRREREFRELNHRIANSLQLAADLLIFQQQSSDDAGAREMLAAAGARLVAVGQLHRYLYEHAAEPLVEFETFLDGLCDAISRTTGLDCAVRADPVMVPGDMAQQLAIAINELAINAGKHAYRDGGPRRLMIESRREAGWLRLTVSDFGKGLGGGFDPQGRSGLGMSIVHATVRQLDGSLTAEDDHGARFTITVPLPAAVTPMGRSFADWAGE